MIILLTLVSVALIAIFFAVLVIGVILIAGTLEQIGGGRSSFYSGRLSDLGRIAFGVRAIEQQTSHLGPSLTRLNESLTRTGEGLGRIDATLAEATEALKRQRRSP
jgi:hypothetical protein